MKTIRVYGIKPTRSIRAIVNWPCRGPALLLMIMLLTLLPASVSAADQPSAAGSAVDAILDRRMGDVVQPAGLLPSSSFDPDEIGWASIRGLTSSQFADHFDAMKDDYMMIDIEVDEIDGKERVSAVWQLNTEDRGWFEFRNLTSTQFHDKWTELKDDGYRLIDQEAYTLNDQSLYAGVWVKNVEDLGWASLRNLTSEEFSEKFAQYSRAGYIIIDVEGYPTPDGLRFAMVWVKNVENLSWYEHRNLSSAEFSEKFEEYKGTHRMWDVESYRHNGVQYYAGIWVENSNGRDWAEIRNMTAKDYRNRWYRMRDLGYRLIDFEIYPTENGERYAGIWRQNNARPDWLHRSEVDDLVQAHLEENGVPGIGIAIAQEGETKYIRGFGHQDLENDIWYSSRTINRLASVSKAVAGVLAMHLVEQGAIADLDEASTNVIPGLPAHHTHTLRQLLSNRSGIGHYGDYSVPVQPYGTAQSAFETFWNSDGDPNTRGTQLVYEPGIGCQYSTHALTGVGAWMEAVANKPIGQIVADELTTPYGLPTLRQEQPDDGNSHRTVAYNDDGNPQAWGDASWKVLGGGLESSTYDMVRFLMKVIDGSIISADAYTEMTTVPEPMPCISSNDNLIAHQYALGWRVGTKYNTPLMWKGGNWNPGANTHVRIYPELETAIVVLSNLDEGHDTRALAASISDVMFAGRGSTGEAVGYDVDGIAHNVAGEAQATFNRDRGLVLSNIGASGNDGVDSLAPGARLWESHLQIQLESGQSNFETAAVAQDGRALSVLRIEATRDGAQIQAQFDQSGHQVQFIEDNQIVHVVNPGDDGTAAVSINWDLIWCLIELPHEVPSQLCDLYYGIYANQDDAWEWNLRFPASLTMMDPQGEILTFDRLRLLEIREEQMRVTAAQEELQFDTIQLRGQEVELFILDDVVSGGAEAIPPLPTELAEAAIFLPIVANP